MLGLFLPHSGAWTGALKMCTHMWKHVQFRQNLLLNSARNTATHSLKKIIHRAVVTLACYSFHWVSKIKLNSIHSKLFTMYLVFYNSWFSVHKYCNIQLFMLTEFQMIMNFMLDSFPTLPPRSYCNKYKGLASSSKYIPASVIYQHINQK